MTPEEKAEELRLIDERIGELRAYIASLNRSGLWLTREHEIVPMTRAITTLRKRKKELLR